MCRARNTLVTTLACLIMAGTAHAGINFTAADPTSVAPRPEYMASTDFNNDGRADIMVVSPSSNEVDVFLAADTPSHYEPARSLRLGDNPQGFAVADLNADGRVDAVVTDQSAKKVWILLGNGDGTFPQPYARALPPSATSPVAVAIGNFDDKVGPDLAVADKRSGRLLIMTNDGASPPNFNTVTQFVVGDDPEQVIAADFNNDGKLDLVTLNTGGPLVKDISIVLLGRVVNGVPDFGQPRHINVGARPSDMQVADFNNDGNLDIAMLNHPTTIGSSDIDIFLGSGNGDFQSPRITTVDCPFFAGDAQCRGLSMAIGDLDGNGTVDVAVALVDPRNSGGSTSPGIADAMLIFSGLGDGNFGPGPAFSVLKAPVSMAIGDVTGDGKPEISVANQKTLSLQCFVNISTPADKVDGEPCLLGDECISARCTNGVCCASACEENEVCNVPGREGICNPMPPQAPQHCTSGDACSSTFCVDGYCCDEACNNGHCDVPHFVGLCIPGLADGAPCTGNDRQCASNHCSENLVCCREACTGGFCDGDGVCHALLPPGGQCDVDEQCQTNVCDTFDLICCKKRCDENVEFCNPGGQCQRFDDVPNTPTPTASPRSTPGRPGELCSAGADCDPAFCVNGVCCQVEACNADQHCQEGTGVCVAGTTPGPNTPTPTRTPQPTVTGGTENCGGQCPPERCINNFCVVTSSSSGCSTGGGATDGGNLLVVALMPLALWLGRRWQLHRALARARAPRS